MLLYFNLGFTFARSTIVSAFDWHNEIFLRHQIVFGDELRETMTQERLALELIEYSPMVEICVRKNPIDSTTNGA